MTRTLRALTLAVLASLALVAAGCGGGDDEGNGGGPSGTPAGKQGGKLTMLASTDVDFLDPGHTYYTFGYVVAYPTHRTLYSFKPESQEPTPDLAESEPQVSDDLKTVTVKIRPGVRFSPPVNREVTSKDVKYAFERFFTENVGGGYPGFFNSIVGAPQEPGPYKPIRGIQTPDDQTIVFKLSKPAGVTFAAALVMPITAPVPKEYAQKFDRKNPSTYNSQVVATGPYMVRNDPKTGKLVGYKPGRSIELVRNPNWDKATDYKPAYLDEILIKTNATDSNVSGRQVLRGKGLMLDAQPPTPVIKLALQRHKDQILTIPGGGYRYIPMNITIKPFDDVDVRRAVAAAFDRDAARKARGGTIAGEIATHYLHPGFPGHEEGGGLEGPGFDFLKNPRGDMAVATEYMKKAGYESGKYDGPPVTMVGADADPGKAVAEVAQAQFEKLGFEVKLRLVPQDAVYTEYCQQPQRKIAICANAGWFKDFNDPQAMLEPTFKGDLIMKDGGNNNLAQLDDDKIDAAMDKAALIKDLDERYQAWGEIDKMITEQMPAVPYVWDKTTLIASSDVDAKPNYYYDGWDLAHSSLK